MNNIILLYKKCRLIVITLTNSLNFLNIKFKIDFNPNKWYYILKEEGL